MNKSTDVQISKTFFTTLLKLLKKKYERELREEKITFEAPSGNAGKYYGFGPRKENQTLPVMTEHILEKVQHPKDRMSPKYFYNLENLFRDKSPEYTTAVKEEILKILLLYLYIQSDEKGKFQKVSKEEKNLSLLQLWKKNEDFFKYSLTQAEFRQQLIYFNERENVNEQTITSFTVYYYSVREHLIRKFKLNINFFSPTEKGYPAECVGFHKEEGDTLYKGHAIEKTSCLYISLFSENGNMPMNLLGFTDILEPHQLPLIHFGIQTISQFDFPMMVEGIALGKKYQKDQNFLDAIKAYLYVKRRNFRIPKRRHFPIEKMVSKRININKFVKLKGAYRVWNLDYDVNKKETYLVQRVFEILEDYTAILKVIDKKSGKLVKRACLYNISLGGTPNLNSPDSENWRYSLTISTHQEKSVETVSYAIFNLPLDEKDVTEGTYCGVNLHTGYAILIKENEKNKKNLPPLEAKNFTYPEFDQLKNDYPLMDQYQERLFAAYKSLQLVPPKLPE